VKAILIHHFNLPFILYLNDTFLHQVREQGIHDLLSRCYICLDKSTIHDIFFAQDSTEIEEVAQIFADFFI